MEKWKTPVTQGVKPVEKSVEMWITPCKHLLHTTLCYRLRRPSMKNVTSVTVDFLCENKRKREKKRRGFRGGARDIMQDFRRLARGLQNVYGTLVGEVFFRKKRLSTKRRLRKGTEEFILIEKRAGGGTWTITPREAPSGAFARARV